MFLLYDGRERFPLLRPLLVGVARRDCSNRNAPDQALGGKLTCVVCSPSSPA